MSVHFLLFIENIWKKWAGEMAHYQKYKKIYGKCICQYKGIYIVSQHIKPAACPSKIILVSPQIYHI